jgi:hypothetical protein
MSFIYSNPWADAAAYGQAMGNTLAQSLVQIPAIRAQMALQQAQLARQGQQDDWEARRMNWEADEQKRRGTAFDTEQTARKLNIEAAQQALAQGQQRQAIVSQIPGKMYSGPMADPANKDSLMNLVQQLAIMQNPAGVWESIQPKQFAPQRPTVIPAGGTALLPDGSTVQGQPRTASMNDPYRSTVANNVFSVLGGFDPDIPPQDQLAQWMQVPAFATQYNALTNQAPAQYSMPVTQPQQQSQQSPKPGMIYKGYRFLGGDPADKKNWEEVQ